MGRVRHTRENGNQIIRSYSVGYQFANVGQPQFPVIEMEVCKAVYRDQDHVASGRFAKASSRRDDSQ